MKRSALLLPILLFLLSCSVQKRHYQKGYCISWHKHVSVSATAETKQKTIQKVANKKQIEADLVSKDLENKTDIFASSSNELNSGNFTKSKIISNPEDSCDVILYKDGSEIKVKITEISSANIKYKRCDMPEGPVYVANKTQIFMIKYANGTKEVVKTSENTYTSSAQNPPQKVRKRKKITRLSTGALIFSILGFYPLIMAGGIAAIIMASVQLYKIRMYPDDYGAERKAIIALVIGIVGVLFWGIIIAASLFLV